MSISLGRFPAPLSLSPVAASVWEIKTKGVRNSETSFQTDQICGRNSHDSKLGSILFSLPICQTQGIYSIPEEITIFTNGWISPNLNKNFQISSGYHTSVSPKPRDHWPVMLRPSFKKACLLQPQEGGFRNAGKSLQCL